MKIIFLALSGLWNGTFVVIGLDTLAERFDFNMIEYSLTMTFGMFIWSAMLILIQDKKE